MKKMALLKRLGGFDLPAKLSVGDDIEVARQLAASLLIKVAIPAKLKGLHNYGEQGPALVLAITSAGWLALAKLDDEDKI